MAEQTLATPAKKWAREYETIYIMRPTVEPDAARKVSDRVTEVMGRMGAKITKVETWGMRRLAYSIQKHSRGVFVYVRYAAYGDVVAELERNLRLLDIVIRFQSIRVRDGVDLEALEVDGEETTFDDIEQGEDIRELTTAEKLGMSDRSEREPKEEAKAEAAEGEKAEAAEGEKAEAAEGEKAEAAEGETAAEGEAAEGDAAEGDAAAETTEETEKSEEDK